MKLFTSRITYVIAWAIVIIIAIPLSAVVFPFILAANIPSVFMDKWPRKALPPKKQRIQMFIPVADSNFSQN